MEKIFEIIKDNPIQFGMVNYLAGVLSGHWLAIRRDNRKFYHDTAKSFRSEFVKDISIAINGQWDEAVAEQVINAIPLQGIAVNEFKLYLGWYKRRGFGRAWDRYKNYCTTMDYDKYKLSILYPNSGKINEHPTNGFIKHLKRLLSCLMCKKNGKIAEHPKDEFKKHLNHILSFAKPS